MGKVDRFDVMLSCAGEVKARQLEAVNSSVSISGAAELALCVTGALDVDLSGVGEVTYGCNPQTVTPNISGVGSIQPETP